MERNNYDKKRQFYEVQQTLSQTLNFYADFRRVNETNFRTSRVMSAERWLTWKSSIRRINRLIFHI